VSLDLSDRYGTRRTGQRTVLIIVSVLIAVISLVWLGWATWFHSTPGVTSEMQTFTVLDEHAARTVIAVRVDDGVEANCKVRALAQDHVVVGEQNFVPQDGRNTVEIRTDRLASSVELVGCTAPGQNRPR
jgi:hypothetical protein